MQRPRRLRNCIATIKLSKLTSRDNRFLLNSMAVCTVGVKSAAHVNACDATDRARHGPHIVLRFVSSTECFYDTHWLLTCKSCARAECFPMFHIATFKFRFDHTSSSRLVDRRVVAEGFVSFASRLICFKLGSTAIAKAVTEPNKNNPLADCFLRQVCKASMRLLSFAIHTNTTLSSSAIVSSRFPTCKISP